MHSYELMNIILHHRFSNLFDILMEKWPIINAHGQCADEDMLTSLPVAGTGSMNTQAPSHDMFVIKFRLLFS